MKATLQFTLPEEEYEFNAAVKGAASLRVIDELLAELRTAVKYNGGTFRQDESVDESISNACYNTLEQVREYIWTLRDLHNIPSED